MPARTLPLTSPTPRQTPQKGLNPTLCLLALPKKPYARRGALGLAVRCVRDIRAVRYVRGVRYRGVQMGRSKAGCKEVAVLFETQEHRLLKVRCFEEGVPMATWLRQLALRELGKTSKAAPTPSRPAPPLPRAASKESIVSRAPKAPVKPAAPPLPAKPSSAQPAWSSSGWGDGGMSDLDRWKLELQELDTEDLEFSPSGQAEAKELAKQIREAGGKVPVLQYMNLKV